MRRRDVWPMSISMHGAKKRADSVVGGSAAVCLPPSPHLILFSRLRGDESTAVTRGVYLSQDKKAISPTIRPNMEALLVCLSAEQGGLGSGKLLVSLLHTYQKFSCSVIVFFVIIPSFFAAIFFPLSLSQQNHEGTEAEEGECDAGRRSWELIVPSKRVNLYS